MTGPVLGDPLTPGYIRQVNAAIPSPSRAAELDATVNQVQPLAVTATAKFREHWHGNAFPWCDTCLAPAVLVDRVGWRHATGTHPQGVPREQDPKAHAVTTLAWHAGQTTPDDTTSPIVTIQEDDPR